MMKRSSIILFFAALYSLGSSQDINILVDTLTLDSAITPAVDMSIRAMDWVKLSPGFQYEAQQNKEFRSSYYAFGSLDDDNTYGGHPDTAISNLVGNDGMVGAIPGSFSVSPSGAAVYSIPIQCPEGINGMTPGVSLVYNSQAGNGVAGYGWNIGGISSIMRTPKSIYHDDIIEGIQWDTLFPLALDGSRLIHDESNTSYILYKIENNPRAKVYHYNYDDPESTYFIVYPGNGSKFTYQQTYTMSEIIDYELNRRINGTDTFDIITNDTTKYSIGWYLSEVADPFGNKINYNYSSTEDMEVLVNDETTDTIEDITFYHYQSIIDYHTNDFRISSIDYGNGTNLFYSIDFEYETRSDTILGYIAGVRNRDEKRLKQIDITYDETDVIRSYKLNYSYDLYSYLESVELEGENNTKLNKTVFERDDYSYSANDHYDGKFQIPECDSSLIINGYTKNSKKVFPGYFNDDNLSDFLVVYEYEKNNIKYYYSYVYFNDGNIDENTTLSVAYEVDPLEYPSNISTGKIFVNDMDNDGVSELYVQLKDSCVSNNCRFYYIALEYNESQGTFVENSSKDIENYGRAEWVDAFAGDFDGDGETEVLLLDQDYNYENSSGFESLDTPDFGTSLEVNLLDFNGNGKPDILLKKSNQTEIYEYSNRYNEFVRWVILYEVESTDLIVPGDYNGDGNSDLLVFDDSEDQWEMLISNGTSYQNSAFDLSQLSPYSVYNDKYFSTDINQDGKADLIRGSSTLYFYITKGNSFESEFTKSNIYPLE
ncbi:MAG: FG-GAP-like repeat-containing protein, partial [Bacteroidales bacterium]